MPRETKASKAISDDHPMMVAWEAYKKTSAYKNVLTWVVHEDQTEDLMWAAFVRGYEANALSASIKSASTSHGWKEVKLKVGNRYFKKLVAEPDWVEAPKYLDDKPNLWEQLPVIDCMKVALEEIAKLRDYPEKWPGDE